MFQVWQSCVLVVINHQVNSVEHPLSVGHIAEVGPPDNQRSYNFSHLSYRRNRLVRRSRGFATIVASLGTKVLLAHNLAPLQPNNAILVAESDICKLVAVVRTIPDFERFLSQAECPSLRVQGGGQKCYVCS